MPRHSPLLPSGFRALGVVALSCLSLLTTGCNAARWVGMQVAYDRVLLPEGRVERDLAYVESEEDPVDPKHRLNLYLPGAAAEAPEGGWPVLVFAHGGGWSEGDKDLLFGGEDIYGNIGRFYAGDGIAVATINYRLQPGVTWKGQVADVARAIAWVHDHLGEYGGNPDRLFLSGHSAGAQLVARVAVSGETLGEVGLVPADICGVIGVSGAAYDLADQETYELGADPAYYEGRFRAGDAPGEWQKKASSVTWLDAADPPFRLFYTRKEWPSLQHQNQVFKEALEKAGVPAILGILDGGSHSRMVLAMTDLEQSVAPVILAFLRDQACDRS